MDTEFLKNEEIQLVLEKTVDGDEKRNWVPAYHFFICNLDGIKMGACDLRIGYNDNLYYGGHIGYHVFRNTAETIMQVRPACYCFNLPDNIIWNIYI